ncbi:molybdopterin-containing oxidoreductase family protein [Acrocarpospora catenulata]|uniref:molybdopterin-containing oxidoreductase family protein n=1 Tax=Acrocarpospora catenulata TaxID=2836182 RepID=UPI002023A608|nr:molybdopterin-dependent oxidoreductase [Acrocarpospora catenulata]
MTVRSYCRFCVAHCGLLVDVDDGQVVRATGDAEHPLSAGYTCAKGRALPGFHHDPDRLDTPMVGRAGPDRRPTTWDTALADLAARLATISRESGPDAIAVFNGSGGGMDAAGALAARRLARALGTTSVYSPLTIDAPAKPLVGALVAGQPGLFAAGVAPGATLTVLVGSNPVISHGHSSGAPNPRTRLRELTARGEVWVVDPRRTETAEMATRHLAPRPGTDHVWLAALVNEMLAVADHRALARETTGLAELADCLAPYDLALAGRVCGIPPDDLVAMRDALRRHGRFAGLTGTGVTMSRSGTLTQWLMLVLQIVTGSADAPGGTWFNPGFIRSLDRHPWRTGDHRPRPGPPSRPELPRQFGEQPTVALLDEIETGNVRALLILGANLASCLPDTGRALRALRAAEVVAVADVVHNGMTRLATHLLPCAGQLERPDLTYLTDQYAPEISAQYTDAVVPPAADRRELWRILADLGERLGRSILPGGVPVAQATADTLFADALRTARCDLETLRAARVVVDPEPATGWVRAGVRERGGWNLAPAELRAAMYLPVPAGELVLLPRRQLRHFNSQLTTGPAGDGSDAVYLNPLDAADLGIGDAGPVTVTSEFGALDALARLDRRLPRGAVSVPHGFERTNVNRLTSTRTGIDPLTGMPTLSGLPVQVTPRTPGGQR